MKRADWQRLFDALPPGLELKRIAQRFGKASEKTMNDIDVWETIKVQEKQLQRLCDVRDAEKLRADTANAIIAEMRDAFASFECTICDENHKFRAECNACLSGQPSACTCCNEELVDCPCCMEGDYAEGYRKLRHAISADAGKGWVSPAKAQQLIDALTQIKEKCNEPPDVDKIADIFDIVENATGEYSTPTDHTVQSKADA